MKGNLISILIISLIISTLRLQCFAVQADTVRNNENVVITGVGDIMFGTAFPSAKYLPPHNNPLLLLGDLADTLAASDITFGNLEGSFLNYGIQQNATSSGCRNNM
jgi:hypothetical protein